MFKEYEILHNEFDMNVHKANFVNYFESVISPEGIVEYAIPSHQEKLISVLMDQNGWTRQDLLDACPEEYYMRFHEWLSAETGYLMVWNDFYVGEPTDAQVAILMILKENGIFNGSVPEIEFGCKELNLTQNAQELYKVFAENYIVSGYMYSGGINSERVDNELCINKDSLDELIAAGIVQLSNSCSDYELTISERRKIIGSFNLSEVWSNGVWNGFDPVGPLREFQTVMENSIDNTLDDKIALADLLAITSGQRESHKICDEQIR